VNDSLKVVNIKVRLKLRVRIKPSLSSSNSNTQNSYVRISNLPALLCIDICSCI